MGPWIQESVFPLAGCLSYSSPDRQSLLAFPTHSLSIFHFPLFTSLDCLAQLFRYLSVPLGLSFSYNSCPHWFSPVLPNSYHPQHLLHSQQQFCLVLSLLAAHLLQVLQMGKPPNTQHFLSTEKHIMFGKIVLLPVCCCYQWLRAVVPEHLRGSWEPRKYCLVHWAKELISDLPLAALVSSVLLGTPPPSQGTPSHVMYLKHDHIHFGFGLNKNNLSLSLSAKRNPTP